LSGLYLESSSNNVITSSDVYSNNGSGIYLESSSSGNVITNSNVSLNKEMGVYIISSINNILYGSTVIGNLQSGIRFYQSTGNNVSEVDVLENGFYGILLEESSNNNLLNTNVIDSNNHTGIYIESSSNNRITGGKIRFNKFQGIMTNYGSNNNVTRSEIYSNGGVGLRISYSSGNFIRDSIINNSGSYDVYLIDTNPSNTSFINVTFDKNDVSVNSNAILWVKWYLDTKVIDNFGEVLGNVSVNIADVYGTLWFDNATNSSGYIPRLILPEYNQTSSGKFYYTNYNLNASKFAYWSNETSFNLTTNKFLLVGLQKRIPSVKVRTYTKALVETSIFKPKRMVRIRAEVTHDIGRDYIRNSTLLFKDSSGSTLVNNELMSNVSEITGGYLYEYNYSLPENSQGVWRINVTATDSFGNEYKDSTSIAIIPLSIQVKLVLNNTSSKVYIPGVGEKTFSGLTSSTYLTPDHFYLASYLNNVLISLVFSFEKPVSIFTGKTSNTYSLGMDQKFSNSRVFLVFSKGDWRTIDKRMEMIEKGEFLSKVSPSFAFGLGKQYPIRVALEYNDIAINGSLTVGRGYHKITIENIGESEGKVILRVRRI
jgi:parallel beta-helix repeat protein